jgi:hypothetical protein
MKYIFGLLFEYEYYKNPANIKIFFNDHLIDDIDLTENINIRNIPFDPSWLPIDASIRRSKTWDFLKFLEIPEKVFVYTLDETIIQNSIKIKVTNNNSNYTNGFMTKWSSFEFHGIFLMPACYLNYKAYDEINVEQTNAKANIPDYPTAPEAMYSLQWPGESRVVRDGEFITDGTDKENWTRHTKGGSFSMEFPIIEYIHKKGLKMIGPINYEQLLEKEKRLISVSDTWPLYLKHLKLINTQNETA